MKLSFILALVCAVSAQVVTDGDKNDSLDAVCVPSLTTVSGRYAPTGQICANTLIFNEDFNNFNMDLWMHKVTMDGGGVSISFMLLFRVINFILRLKEWGISLVRKR